VRLAVLLALLPPIAHAGCPVAGEKLGSVGAGERREICRRSAEARAAAQSMPDTYSELKRCDAALKLAAEMTNVSSSLAGREKSVKGKLDGALAGTSPSLGMVNGLHSYVNVSLAAAFRADLEARKLVADIDEGSRRVSHDAAVQESEVARAKKEEERYRSGKDDATADVVRDTEEASAARLLAAARGVADDLELAKACVESARPSLKSAFETWKAHKAALLVPAMGKILGEREQARQQYVYDVLTDPAKQDLAYKIDVGCPDAHCYLIFAGAGFLLNSSFLRTVGWIIVTGLAGDLAMRQGLDAGQQIREAGNAAVGVDLLKTEVSRIDAGEVVPFGDPDKAR
jgi:hypothetical protein